MKVTVEGIETSYSTEGSGPVIVLLHGWGSSKENFDYLQQTLAKSYQVIAVDFPGFGESAQPPLNWRVDDYAGFISAFLDSLKVGHVHAFVAHSFGGRVAVKGLGLGVLRAENLVLIGSAGVGHSRSLRNVTYAVLAKVGKVIMSLPILRSRYDVARSRLHKQAGSTDYAAAGDMQQIFLNTVHDDLREYISDLAVPTLLIWGSDDMEAPLADARFFHEHIKGSTLKILQGAGHFVHNEQPDKVLQFVKEFLA